MRASEKSKISFSLATPADDPAIRRLLRNNPMQGAISLSLEREPDYVADAHQPGETKQTIVARESGRIICVGNCTTRLRFVNGQPRRVGYLGGLRLDASVAGRFDILRRGYEFFRELQANDPADFYFTSIAADNHRARSLLERNLRGLPRYEFLGEFVTLLIGAPSAASASSVKYQQRAEAALGAPDLSSSLNNFNQNFQLAPHWTANQLAALHQLGLRDEDWFGEAALWDQRHFKQTVIRGYAPWLALLRPALNLVARLTGKPRLPARGETLSHAFVLHLNVAATPRRPGVKATPPSLDPIFSILKSAKHEATGASLPPQCDEASHLLNRLRSIAAQRGIEWLTLGFAANDPRLPQIRQHFRRHEYHSRLYLVSWPNLGGAATDLDCRILAPEVALL